MTSIYEVIFACMRAATSRAHERGSLRARFIRHKQAPWALWAIGSMFSPRCARVIRFVFRPCQVPRFRTIKLPENSPAPGRLCDEFHKAQLGRRSSVGRMPSVGQCRVRGRVPSMGRVWAECTSGFRSRTESSFIRKEFSLAMHHMRVHTSSDSRAWRTAMHFHRPTNRTQGMTCTPTPAREVPANSR